MAPQHDPEENDGRYRIGHLMGKVEAIEQQLAGQAAFLNKFLGDLKLDVHRHLDEVKGELRDQKRELETDLSKHRTELELRLREAQGETKQTLQQVLRWMYLLMGGGLVAWFFLSHLLEKLWKP